MKQETPNFAIVNGPKDRGYVFNRKETPLWRDLIDNRDKIAAAMLVIEKWEFILEWLIENQEEMRLLWPAGYCAWCELYSNRYSGGDECSIACPLYQEHHKTCNQTGSPFHRFVTALMEHQLDTAQSCAQWIIAVASDNLTVLKEKK